MSSNPATPTQGIRGLSKSPPGVPLRGAARSPRLMRAAPSLSAAAHPQIPGSTAVGRALGAAVTRWPGPSRPRGCHGRTDHEPATVAGDHAFAQPWRHASDQDRPADPARPGWPVAGAGMPDRPQQALVTSVAAPRKAYPADFHAQPRQLWPRRTCRRDRPRRPVRMPPDRPPRRGSGTSKRLHTAWLPP